MGRLIPAFAQWLDGNGDPLAYGWLRFLVSGTNNTDKDTYNDPLYQIPNANPLQLDAEGRCPSVFGLGDYRIISYINDPDEEDSPGEMIQTFDPVTAQGTLEGGGGSGAVFDTWSPSVTYELGAIVEYNLNYYKSLINGNINFDPEIEVARWVQIDFLYYWNGAVTYEAGDLVYYNENLYLSLLDGNINHLPTTSPAYWRAVATGCKGFLHQSGSYSITTTDRDYLVVLDATAVADATFDLPAMDATTDKFCVWIYNASDYVLTLDAAGTAGIWLNTGGTLDITKGALIKLGYNSYLDCWLPMGNTGPTLGNQDVGTATYPVLNFYGQDLFVDNLTLTTLATIESIALNDAHISSDNSLFFGDADQVGMTYVSATPAFEIDLATGTYFSLGVNGAVMWAMAPTGELYPPLTNPNPDLGTAGFSLNFVYTNNISLPDNGYVYLGTSDDMTIFFDGGNANMISTAPMSVGTDNLNTLSLLMNGAPLVRLTTDNSVVIYQSLDIPNNIAIFTMGNPTEFAINRTGSSGPTYINAVNYAVYFKSGSTDVFSYDSTLNTTFYNDVIIGGDTFLTSDNVIYWGSIDASITYSSTGSYFRILAKSLSDIIFRVGSVDIITIDYIGNIIPYYIPNLGSSSSRFGSIYAQSYFGTGTVEANTFRGTGSLVTPLRLGWDINTLFTLESAYEEFRSLTWIFVITVTVNGRTYEIIGNEI